MTRQYIDDMAQEAHGQDIELYRFAKELLGRRWTVVDLLESSGQVADRALLRAVWAYNSVLNMKETFMNASSEHR